MGRGLSNTSLVGIFGVVKAVVDFCIKEQGLDCRTLFQAFTFLQNQTKKECPSRTESSKICRRSVSI